MALRLGRLKVPGKRPSKGRLRLDDGCCVRLRPERPNHVGSCGFVHHRTEDGRALRTLDVLDEFTRECRAIRIERKLNSMDVIDALSDLFILRGVPGFIRSDDGPEFVARVVRDRISAVGARTAFIEPESPWENGHAERFNGRLRDEPLDGGIFHALRDARIVVEDRRRRCSTRRPRSASGCRPPAPKTVTSVDQPPIMRRQSRRTDPMRPLRGAVREQVLSRWFGDAIRRGMSVDMGRLGRDAPKPSRPRSHRASQRRARTARRLA